MLLSKKKVLALLCLAAIPLSSCFVRRRVVAPPGNVTNRSLIVATKEDLVQYILNVTNPIQSFSMRADMSPSVGSLYGGELTDYATVRTYVLFKRADNIRVIGLDPVVHSTTIFDMVSTGNDFRVSIPSKNRFIEGDNRSPPSSKNKLENLRPTAFLNALIIDPPAAGEITLLEEDTDNSKSVYELLIVRREGEELHLMRSVYFNRYTLGIFRQRTFDAAGNIASEANYSDWKPYGAVSFPTVIQIRRPQDGYEVTMTVIEMTINTPDVTPEKFVLEQPPGTQLERLK